MTSKSLFFRFMCEDLKQKLWAVGLSFLCFFLAMPVNAAMNLSIIQKTYDNWVRNGTVFGDGITAESRYAERLLDVIETTIGLENVWNVTVITVASIVMALTGFMYLHSKKQTDFYHSIPIKRELIFMVKYVNGVAIIFSMYLLNLLLTIGILLMNQIDAATVFTTSMITFCVHISGYLMNFGLMVIAVMLTGNFFISILGGMILFAYVPSVIALVQGLMYLFFNTINLRDVRMEMMMVHGSPISYYIETVINGAGMEYEKYGQLMGTVGIMFVVGLLMALASLLLYKKRPSEASGKALSFPITKAPSKILLVVPITIATSILFWNIYYSLPWTVFGFVMGLVVTHALVEIIYHFEFAKLFANLHHMGLCAGLALAVILVFRYDLLGYDRYKPTEKEFEYASVYAENLRDNPDYGLPYYYESNGVSHQSWRYMSMDQYVVDHMKYTDYEVVSKLSDAGIRESEMKKEALYNNVDMQYSNGYWTQLEVGYHLKNGRTVYRNYYVNLTELRETFDQMYESAEYKQGIVPVLSYDPANIIGIFENHNSKIQEVNADETLCAEILEAYKEEMKALTLEERSKETPVTSLRFLTIAEYEYICTVSHDKNPNFSGDFRIEDMSVVNFFPVYPSFVKTLQLLEKVGIDDLGSVSVEDVLRIELFSDYYTDEKAYYDAPSDYYEERVSVMTDKVTMPYPATVTAEHGLRTITLEDDGTAESVACMEEVLEYAVYEDLMNLNGLQSREYGITVRVYLKDENEGRPIGSQEFVPYQFHADEIPQFIKDLFEYDTRVSKNISYGLNIPIEN
ncbi:MAG: hypothetical protein IKU20_09710 [Lachnospiraceae bacterium]|nr:hypothetical protein [Lachnospiraceae bacterium]